MRQCALDFIGPAIFDASSLAIAPSVSPQARETSALAANANLSRRATQTARVLSIIRHAGEQGISDLELQRATGYSRQTICARRGWDLRSLIEPAAKRYEDPVSKRTFTRWRLKDVSR